MNASPRKARLKPNVESTISKRDGGFGHDHGRMKIYRTMRARFSVGIAPSPSIRSTRVADCFGVLADERNRGQP